MRTRMSTRISRTPLTHAPCHSCVYANSIKWFLNSNKEVFIILGFASDLLYFPPPYHDSNTHTHTHHSSQIGFPHWSYATAAGANQTLRCPNIPDIPALFQTHKLNLWTHLFACQWPKREKQSTAFIWPRCSRSTAWLTTRAITTLALPDSRKTYAKVMTRSTVSGLLHVGPQGKGKNMRKEKEQRIDMLCRFNS